MSKDAKVLNKTLENGVQHIERLVRHSLVDFSQSAGSSLQSESVDVSHHFDNEGKHTVCSVAARKGFDKIQHLLR
jgi:hypothetical protein